MPPSPSQLEMAAETNLDIIASVPTKPLQRDQYWPSREIDLNRSTSPSCPRHSSRTHRDSEDHVDLRNYPESGIFVHLISITEPREPIHQALSAMFPGPRRGGTQTHQIVQETTINPIQQVEKSCPTVKHLSACTVLNYLDPSPCPSPCPSPLRSDKKEVIETYSDYVLNSISTKRKEANIGQKKTKYIISLCKGNVSGIVGSRKERNSRSIPSSYEYTSLILKNTGKLGEEISTISREIELNTSTSPSCPRHSSRTHWHSEDHVDLRDYPESGINVHLISTASRPLPIPQALSATFPDPRRVGTQTHLELYRSHTRHRVQSNMSSEEKLRQCYRHLELYYRNFELPGIMRGP